MSSKVATIGFFDGVHRGHQFLCRQLRQLAGQGGTTLVLTFDEHPQRVLGRPSPPQLLTSNAEKAYFLENVCGMDEVIFLAFTEEIASLSAREFMEKYLRDQYHVTHLLIGYDHHFGRPQGETFEDYQRFGRELGIEVVLATELPAESSVSSSAIRRMIAEGDVATANAMLGYTYRISGTVVSGHQVGRTIGFPTVNLQPANDTMLLPAAGVYVTMVRVRGRDYPAVTNVGHRPTIGNGPEFSVESHFLGVEKLPPYADEPISVDLYTRLRAEQRFDTIDDLKAQIAQDVAEAVEWHRGHATIYPSL